MTTKIEFTKVQAKLLKELTRRHQTEMNDALIDIYTELKIMDDLKSGGAYRLLPDLSGVEKVEVPKPPEVGDVGAPKDKTSVPSVDVKQSEVKDETEREKVPGAN